MAEVIIDNTQPHLGGNNVSLNRHTFAPEAWTYIIQKYNIRSVLDVGSGYGHHSKWFAEQGLRSYAIEGLQQNVDNAVYPTRRVDLTEGSYTTQVDMVNCIEVVEHVEEKYIDNLLTTLTCGKYIFMTHGIPGQRGHHHVNCQWQEYWIEHMESRGFNYAEEDSKEIRKLCTGTKQNNENGKHINESGLFFIRKEK
jgi:SAM-dependent methyltransferase|tara:strand:+ start:658 stop:1245 length:588 start_codon:yes stop_codon:yes gene_type:complete